LEGTVSGKRADTGHVHVHCHAHRLNLAIVDVAKDIDGVGDTFGLLETIYALQSVSTLRNVAFFCCVSLFLAYVCGVAIGIVMVMPIATPVSQWLCKRLIEV
jgi:hypothetical protein